MKRERILKVVLVVVGVLFSAGIYPLLLSLRQEPALAMMLSLYVTLGIFLLSAARNPSAYRSLIAFTARLNASGIGHGRPRTLSLPTNKGRCQSISPAWCLRSESTTRAPADP